MEIFKPYTFSWWQIAILKMALLFFGIAIGAYWHSFFGANLMIFVIVGLAAGLYIAYISFKK